MPTVEALAKEQAGTEWLSSTLRPGIVESWLDGSNDPDEQIAKVEAQAAWLESVLGRAGVIGAAVTSG